MGDQDLQLREGLGKTPNLSTKNWLLHPIPPLIADHILEKIISKAFRQIVPKTLPMVQIFSFIITTYLKKVIGIKTLSTKQYPEELSPWSIPTIFPILPKMFPLLSFSLLSPPCMDCPTFSSKPTIWENLIDGGRILLHFLHRKNPLHQMQFSCNHPIQASFISVVIAVVSFF